MSASDAPPVVLIHGLWITAESWTPWVERLGAAGFQVSAPSYPGLERSTDDLRSDPEAIARVTTQDVVDHFVELISTMPTPPILIGHSFGGLLVQLLLDRGLGSVGVALNPAGPRGVRTITLAQVRSLLPALRNPANRRRSVAVDLDGFHRFAANALTRNEARVAHEQDIIPAPGALVFDLALANLSRSTPLQVDFRRSGRAPLLLVAGGEDRMCPPTYVRELHRRHAANDSLTSYREVAGRSHYIGQAGWESLADFVIDWSVAPRAVPSGDRATIEDPPGP